MFDHAVAGKEAAWMLTNLKQGGRSVAEYSIEFRTLAAECNWNQEAQWDMFLHGLAEGIQREIYILDLPPGLNDLIDLAIRVDARINRWRDFSQTLHVTETGEDHYASNQRGTTCTTEYEPMQLGRMRLSREERERRKSHGLCLYCGRKGHFINTCPVKETAR